MTPARTTETPTANREGGAERVACASFFITKYRGRDSNPHDLTVNGFSYHHGFRRPPLKTVCGLDYTFTFYYARSVTVRQGPSSLYTFPGHCPGLSSVLPG